MSNAWALMGSHFPTLPESVGAAPTGAGSTLPISWPLTGGGETIMKVEDQWKTLRVRASGTLSLVLSEFLGGDTISRDFDITGETTVAGDDWGALVPGSGPFEGGRDWELLAETTFDDVDSAGLGAVDMGVTVNVSVNGLYLKNDGTYAKGIVVEAVGFMPLGSEYFYRDTHTTNWIGGVSGFAGVDEPVGEWAVFGTGLPARRAQDWHVNGDPTLAILILEPVTLTVDVTARFAAPAALG